MIGLGILLVLLGPLLLLLATWLLYRLAWWALPRLGPTSNLNRRQARLPALGAAVVVVVVSLAASYIPGRLEFESLCAEHGDPVVTRRVETDGFLYNRTLSYWAQRQLSKREQFDYVEIPHRTEEGVYLRISRGPDGRFVEEETNQLESRFRVHETLESTKSGVNLSKKEIYEITTGEELARAASVHYMGGPLSLFLGLAGSKSSCKELITQEGSRDFQTYYDLESIVLGGQPMPEGLQR